MRAGHVRTLSFSLVLFAACGEDSAPMDLEPDAMLPDAAPDGPIGGGCDPATVLPASYRVIPKVATTPVVVTTADGVTSGTIDATAGGFGNSTDNPYLYLDLKTGARVEVSDVQARDSDAWDLALKRSSIRLNGGDSGTGNRKAAVVAAATLAEVTAGPAAGYTVDDFTTETCTLKIHSGGEPMSAIGEWYLYDTATNRLAPKPEVYVIERADKSRVAVKLTGYYDPAMPARSAVYSVEWKNLPGAP
jgi:hypothetical protein